MFLDIRTTTLRPGYLRPYLDLLRGGVWARELVALGPTLECVTVEVGVINRVVRLRTFATLEERGERRGRLTDDGAWTEFRRKTEPWLHSDTDQVMSSAPF